MIRVVALGAGWQPLFLTLNLHDKGCNPLSVRVEKEQRLQYNPKLVVTKKK